MIMHSSGAKQPYTCVVLTKIGRVSGYMPSITNPTISMVIPAVAHIEMSMAVPIFTETLLPLTCGSAVFFMSHTSFIIYYYATA
jgi:hypothetical protein